MVNEGHNLEQEVQRNMAPSFGRLAETRARALCKCPTGLKRSFFHCSPTRVKVASCLALERLLLVLLLLCLPSGPIKAMLAHILSLRSSLLNAKVLQGDSAVSQADASQARLDDLGQAHAYLPFT